METLLDIKKFRMGKLYRNAEFGMEVAYLIVYARLFTKTPNPV